MTESLHDKSFPNEDQQYRKARNDLLLAEADLRTKLEEVAAARRQLPPGGAIKEDYVFDRLLDGTPGSVSLSELFERGQPSLLVYSFMYAPDAQHPCPMCTSFLDGLNGNAAHISQRINLAVVAKSPIARVQEWADQRGWNHLRMLSSEGNSYNRDYFAETPEGAQLPMCNVFVDSGDGIRHYWASELFFVPFAGGHPRHVDLLWPLWNFLDLTPGGRDSDWFPQLSY